MIRLAGRAGADGGRPWLRRFWLRTGFGLLALGGAAAAGWALWIPAKAALGQHLLAAAYERARERGEASPDALRADAPPLERPWRWADMAPLAKLRFPSLGQERLVLDQASNEAMAWAPGWIRGSAPLGAPGLSAVAAHRDTHFALLKHVGEGDVIEFETVLGDRGRYRVIETKVVDSRRWRLPLIKEGRDLLALSTCFPFEEATPGPLRYLVFAVRVDDPADASARAPQMIEASDS